MGRWLGDEAAPPWLSPDEPVDGEPLHRVARRHPADAELAAQLRVGWQPLARAQHRDPLAQGLLDLAVVWLLSRLRHRAPTGDRLRAASRSSADSAPWM